MDPWNSVSDAVVTEAGITGSLNTTLITLFTGTSVFWAGGAVRTTTGGWCPRTDTTAWSSVAPPALVTMTASESPTTAITGTGSKPPSITGVVTADPVVRLRMVANAPPGNDPGGADTNTTLSPPASRAAAAPVDAAEGGSTGADTISGVGGDSGARTGLGPAASKHPSSQTTAASMPTAARRCP